MISPNTNQALQMLFKSAQMREVMRHAFGERGFTVSGKLDFRSGKPALQTITDLDGRGALALLHLAGVDTDDLTYVRPGEYAEGRVNLDTGDKAGFVFDLVSDTAYADHHAPGGKGGSTVDIIYGVLKELHLLEPTQALDRFVDFVTKVDNFRYPVVSLDKQPKTILGMQQDIDLNTFLRYFADHTDPTRELSEDEIQLYGLKPAQQKRQTMIADEMNTLDAIAADGNVFETKYGKILLNENNRLKTGALAAYTKYDGILSITPGVSFFVGLKNTEQRFDEEELRQKLGNKFQGKIIRDRMWLYNDAEPLRLSTEDIINALA